MARASKYEDVKQGILEQIAQADMRHGRPPAVRDLADRHGVSVSTMHSYLTRLAEEGLVEWSRGRHRSLRCTPQGFPAPSQSAEQ